MRLERTGSIGLGVLVAWWQYRQPSILGIGGGRPGAEQQGPRRVFLQTTQNSVVVKFAEFHFYDVG
jgi:hypothetical protein